MNNPPADPLFDTALLRRSVIHALSNPLCLEALLQNDGCTLDDRTSSVLLLLGELPLERGDIPEVCVILNKRSKEVRQPGDLCCPGGAVEKLDRILARILSFHGSSLSKWPCWRQLKTEQPGNAQLLSMLYAAGVREAWEEMRLNPFMLTFLGPLPTHCLSFFGRTIHPMVAWVSRQKRFRLSWEVERIVQFPLRALLDPFNYGMYRLYVPPHLEWRFGGDSTRNLPCFIYKSAGWAEVLWGATFRIVTQFLEIVFGFQVPDIEKLPLVPASVDDEYVRRQ
jgi:8-oxo-dGTP pyrophosphatase MutT (NUDIX family)